jgi:crossover junction endodeoxyribonuclease RuvC
MIILGVDPGTLITGYGIIQKTGSRLLALDYGCIRPPSSLPLYERYRIIFESLEVLIERHSPNVLAIESQFILKNAQSAIKLGMAKGMAILAAARKSIPVHEYSPRKAKLAVTGTGTASKWQVQHMIQARLQLPAPPQPEDAADALALALCHAQSEGTVCTNPFAARSKTKQQPTPSLNVPD